MLNYTHMQYNHTRGFTLIELLVVIAIIGILSAVVLAALNTARSKGNDAAIQSDLSTIQVQAELYYGGAGNNSYGSSVANGSCAAGMFSADATMLRAITLADGANGSAGGTKCESNGTAYAVGIDLTAVSNYWCVDSSGTAKSESGAVSSLSNTAYACP